MRSASPARLRLMLIERAIDVCGELAGSWRRGHDLGENEWSLRLLDLLTELLSGVASGGREAERRVCQSVSDLYVFLIQHLLAAEAASRAEAIDEIRLVLAIEAQTWQLVCVDERKQLHPTTTAAKAGSTSSFNVQA